MGVAAKERRRRGTNPEDPEDPEDPEETRTRRIPLVRAHQKEKRKEKEKENNSRVESQIEIAKASRFLRQTSSQSACDEMTKFRWVDRLNASLIGNEIQLQLMKLIELY